MLFYVTDEQDTIFRTQPVEKIPDLPCAGQTRFVQNVEVLLSTAVAHLRQEFLQRARSNPCRLELLSCPGRWSESFHTISIALCSEPHKTQAGCLAGTSESLKSGDQR